MSLVFEEGTPIRITKEINVISIERLSCTGTRQATAAVVV